MNTAVFGVPGGGKTTSQAATIRDTKGASAGIDPQASLSLISAAVNSHRKDVIYFRLRERWQPVRFVHVKYYGDEYFDYDERMRVARIFLGRRALDPTTSPLIWEFLEAGLEVIQRCCVPLWWLPYCYQPWTAEFQQMLNVCPDAKLGQLSYFSRTQLRNETSPALRVVEPVCRDPRFQGLCGNDDLGWYVQNGWKIILECDGASRETRRTACLLLETSLMVFAENNECQLSVRTDEVENYDLLTPDVLHWWLTLRKQGVDNEKITQSMAFDEQTLTKLVQGSHRLEFFRCGPEMAARAAKYLVTSTYDPNALWYTHNETPHYMNQGQQEALIAQELMQLPVGTRYVAEHGRVWKESVPLPAAFALPSLWKKKAENAIARWRQTRQDDSGWSAFWRSM